MKNTTAVALLLLVTIGTARQMKVKIDNPRVIPGSFRWDLEIMRTDEWSDPALGHCDFYFSFNHTNFTDVQPTIYFLRDEISSSANYIVTTGHTSDNNYCRAAITYDADAGGQPFYPEQPDQWYKIMTLELPIPDDPSGNTGLDWMTSSSAGCTGTLSALNTSLEGSGDIAISVNLTLFQAEFKDNIVHLTWHTESELSTFGYYLYRKSGAEEPFLRLNDNIIQSHGSSTTPADYSFTDADISPHQKYTYKLEEVNVNGSVSSKHLTTVQVDNIIPATCFLNPNYPNPFNPSTTISFGLTNEGDVQLTIFNIQGKVVRQLVNEKRSAGTYYVTWNGKDEKGTPVTTGLYFYRLKTPFFSKVKKMLYAK